MIWLNVYIYRLTGSMQQKFLSNLFITLGVNLLIKPIWIFAVDRTFQNRLGLAEYGMYSNLFAFSILLSVLLDLGLNNFNTTTLSKNNQSLTEQFIPLATIKLLMSGTYLLLTSLLGFLYGFSGYQLYLLFILSFNQCLAYASTFLRSNLSGLYLFKTDAFISATDRLVMTIGGLSILLFSWLPISIETFIYLQTVGYVAAVLASFLAVKPYLSSLKHTLPFSQIWHFIKRSAPFALLALVMLLYGKLDVLLLKKLNTQGDIENGIYAQSTRLVEAINMMAVLVSGLLLPMFSAMLQRNQPLTHLIKLASTVLLAPAIIGVAACIFYADSLLSLLYHHTNQYHQQVFKYTIASVVPICTMYVFGTLLTAKGNLRLLIIPAIIALLFNSIANYLFIPQYGALACAIICLITHSIVAVCNWVVSLYTMPTGISWFYAARFVFFGCVCFLVLPAFQLLQVGLYIQLGLYFCLAFTIAFAMGFIDKDVYKKALELWQNKAL
jgi:O-antigen/teichoic acid export membrane protein